MQVLHRNNSCLQKLRFSLHSWHSLIINIMMCERRPWAHSCQTLHHCVVCASTYICRKPKELCINYSSHNVRCFAFATCNIIGNNFIISNLTKHKLWFALSITLSLTAAEAFYYLPQPNKNCAIASRSHFFSFPVEEPTRCLIRQSTTGEFWCLKSFWKAYAHEVS